MKKDTFQKLEKLPFFTLDTLRSQLGKNPLPTIKYNIKVGKIVRLKRGVYVTEEFVKKVKYQGKLENYLEFLATRLISPSYLSLEYMLSKYGILTESPFTLTLITLKTPRIVKNSLATFTYSNIKKELFCGFNFVRKSSFEIKYATKAKALFDFLYLKKRVFKVINKEVLEELRLNLEELEKSDWEEFENYLFLSKSYKMERIFRLLKKL